MNVTRLSRAVSRQSITLLLILFHQVPLDHQQLLVLVPCIRMPREQSQNQTSRLPSG